MLESPTQSAQTLTTFCTYNFLGNIMWIRVGRATHGNKHIVFLQFLVFLWWQQTLTSMRNDWCLKPGKSSPDNGQKIPVSSALSAASVGSSRMRDELQNSCMSGFINIYYPLLIPPETRRLKLVLTPL